jgi:hypothetical protein
MIRHEVIIALSRAVSGFVLTSSPFHIPDRPSLRRAERTTTHLRQRCLQPLSTISQMPVLVVLPHSKNDLESGPERSAPGY